MKNYKHSILLAVVLTSLFYFSLYKGYKYVETRDNSNFQAGLEIGHFSGLTEGYENAKSEDWNMLSSNKEIVNLIRKHFPDYAQARIITAVLKHESQLKTNAKSYNCYYTNKEGKQYSTFCKKGDEHKAWSVDCGIAMLNYHGKTCPAYTMNPDLALAKTKDMVEKRGFNPWVSFTSGAYLQYLK